ncbi:MAG: hypothetical protein ACI93R_002417 [Flavobacteriales bacterium]|jgi:hypothetical protein
MLYVASILLVLIGLAHSYLGEKYILVRLFRRDNLPHLLGSDWFTKRILRFAWHITTIAWFGFAAILVAVENPSLESVKIITLIVGLVFLISGLLSLIVSHGKHPSWLVFLSVASLSFYSALSGQL